MDQGEVQSLLIVFTGIALSLAITVVTLFILFQRRKNRLLQQRNREREAFERELSETQIEIREETLRHISWELHDNIGQLVTLAKIQVQLHEDQNAQLKEASNTIGRAIQELRALSKLINPEALKNLSLPEAVQMEMDRFNRMRFLEASLVVKGKPRPLGNKEEIIMFRILQEFFSNTTKHSKASSLGVQLVYSQRDLTIRAKDNGVGFLPEDGEHSGIGLTNMRNRAKLIGAQLEITSEKKQGTQLKMQYNFVD
ncbi:MAG: ATP-binding protein [Bacteroidota bacterium]